MVPESLIQDLRRWVCDGEKRVPGSATPCGPPEPTKGAGECLRGNPGPAECRGPSSWWRPRAGSVAALSRWAAGAALLRGAPGWGLEIRVLVLSPAGPWVTWAGVLVCQD